MADAAAARRVAQILLETPKLSIDKMPVLHGIFERVALACTEGLRHICNAPTTFFVNSVKAANSWDVIEDNEDSCAVIYTALEWDTKFMIGVDRRLIFSLVEAVYGGEAGEPPIETDRPFSPLEVKLAKEVCAIAVSSLKSSFETIAPLNHRVERVESKLEFTVLGQRDFPCVSVQILFQVMDNGGRLFMLIPQSALYPMRQRLEKEQSTQEPLSDPRWTSLMQDGISRTDVQLEATMNGPDLTLGEVSELLVGQVLHLQHTAQSLVALESGHERLFWCRIGQASGKFSLIVDHPVDAKGEFIADLISGTSAE